MFETYGEMETAEEINAVARSLKEDGEKENLDKLCKENGIDLELAGLFWDGEIDFITDPAMAAVGKLDLEVKEAKVKVFQFLFLISYRGKSLSVLHDFYIHGSINGECELLLLEIEDFT